MKHRRELKELPPNPVVADIIFQEKSEMNTNVSFKEKSKLLVAVAVLSLVICAFVAIVPAADADVGPSVEINMDGNYITGDKETVFTVTTNGTYAGGNVIAEFETDYPGQVYYLETNDSEYYPLNGNTFGPADGFPFTNGATSTFKTVFNEVGSYYVTVSIKNVDTDEVICKSTAVFAVAYDLDSPDTVTVTTSDGVSTYATDTMSLRKALSQQAAGQTWVINDGYYNVTGSYGEGNTTAYGSAFIISASDITISGKSKDGVVIFADNTNGGNQTPINKINQGSTVYISGNNVEFTDVTVCSLKCYNPSNSTTSYSEYKTLEVTGADVTISNVNIIHNEFWNIRTDYDITGKDISDLGVGSDTYGGVLIVSGNSNHRTVTVQDVTITNGVMNFTWLQGGSVDVVADNVIMNIDAADGYGVNAGDEDVSFTMENEGLTFNLNFDANATSVINNAPAGSSVNVNTDVTLTGNTTVKDGVTVDVAENRSLTNNLVLNVEDGATVTGKVVNNGIVYGIESLEETNPEIVDGKYYVTTFGQLAASIADGATEIILEADITLEESISVDGLTLDLNGHTITTAGYGITATDSTITSTADAKGTVTGPVAYDDGSYFMINAYGETTISNIIIQMTKSTGGNITQGINVGNYYSDVTIDNCEFDVPATIRYYDWNFSSFFAVTVTSGSVETQVTINNTDLSGGVVQYKGGNTHITDSGSFILNITGNFDINANNFVIENTEILGTSVGWYGSFDYTTADSSATLIISGDAEIDLGKVYKGFGNTGASNVGLYVTNNAKVTVDGGNIDTLTMNGGSLDTTSPFTVKNLVMNDGVIFGNVVTDSSTGVTVTFTNGEETIAVIEIASGNPISDEIIASLGTPTKATNSTTVYTFQYWELDGNEYQNTAISKDTTLVASYKEQKAAKVEIGIPTSFTVGQETVFTITFDPTGSNFGGIMVNGTGTFTASTDDYTLWYLEGNEWKELEGDIFGESSGFPLMDVTATFKIVFYDAGVFDLTIDIIDASDRTLVYGTSSAKVIVVDDGHAFDDREPRQQDDFLMASEIVGDKVYFYILANEETSDFTEWFNPYHEVYFRTTMYNGLEPVDQLDDYEVRMTTTDRNGYYGENDEYLILAVYEMNIPQNVDRISVSGYVNWDGMKYFLINGAAIVKLPSGVTIQVDGEDFESGTIYSDETLDLDALITPDDVDDKTVTWSVDDKSIATIDADGFLTPITTGEVTVTVTTSNGMTDTCTVTIKEPRALQYIEVTGEGGVYIKGQMLNTDGIVVTAYYNEGDPEIVTDYTLSGTAIETTDEGYKLVQYGNDLEITVSYTDEGVTETDTFTVTVYPLESITATIPQTFVWYTGEVLTTEDLMDAGLTVEAHYKLGDIEYEGEEVTGSYSIKDVTFNEAGSHPITVTYTDQYGNTASVSFNITVEDQVSP